MLDICRIIIAGALLFGFAVFGSPSYAGTLSRSLPRAEQPVKADPCTAAWPYIVRSCVA